MTDIESNAKAIFFEALDREAPDVRSTYLDEACGDDQELRCRVENLLRAHQDAGGFLEGSQSAVDTTDPPVNAQPGTIIGPYKLLEQIGEGGMGVVSMAEQEQPVRRKVALKIIKPGMDSAQVIARFEAERQALAMMDHPNISRVLDAGTTEGGRPYFAMELVKGTPITEYCDQNQLTVRERLQLFATVCQAIQHAHQKGIIHRDIKPSNVLVALYDGKPVPKVIDFGIAKATQQRLTEKTLFTAFSQVLGTPEYMSPEQIELNQVDVDTRSDVYSLGVLLYELLTGDTPFDRNKLIKAGFDEMRRIIQQEEPRRPSVAISTLQGKGASTVVERRRSNPRQLCDSLRRELDWIVIKTLAKDRDRRYASANELAADVERYLRDEPVQARPPSTFYRIQKFTRRNRAIVVSLATVFIAIGLGLALATSGFLTARRRLAQVTEEQANNRILIEFLSDVYGIPFYMAGYGQAHTVRDSLENLSDDLEERLRDHPTVEIAVRRIFATNCRQRGEHEKAHEHYKRAVDLAEREYGHRSEEVADLLAEFADDIQWRDYSGDAHLFRAQSQVYAERALAIYDSQGIETGGTKLALYALGFSLQTDIDRRTEVEGYMLRKLQISQRQNRGKDSTGQVMGLWDLAVHIARTQEGRDEQVNSLTQQAVDMSRRIHGDQPSLAANVIASQGYCFQLQGDLSQALPRYVEAWDIGRQAGFETEHTVQAFALRLAEIYHATHRHRAAVEVLDELEAICRQHQMMGSLAECLYVRGWGELLREDFAAAATVLGQATELAEKHRGSSHLLVAYGRFNLARSLEGLGRFKEARIEYQKALNLVIPHLNLRPVHEVAYYTYAWALLRTAGRERAEEALDSAERGLAWADKWPPYRRQPHLYQAKAVAQYELGDTRQAVQTLRDGLAKIDFASLLVVSRDAPKTRRELEVTLAQYLADSGELAAAEDVYRDGLENRKEQFGDNDLPVALAELRLGTFLLEHERFDHAEIPLLSAAEKLGDNADAADASREQVARQLAALYAAKGQPAKADKWRMQINKAPLPEIQTNSDPR